MTDLKYYIGNKVENTVMVTPDDRAVYFDTKEVAESALSTFKDELTWYFTEYNDSL